MVAEGQIAVIHYTGRIATGDDAGEVFDTTDVDVALEEEIYHGSRDYKPLKFCVGEGSVIDGIEDAVQTMESGETQTVRVKPENAYGLRSDERVIEVSRAEIEERSDIAAAEGELVKSENDDTGWITDVTAETVEIDFNHELADELVEFEIRVLDTHDENDEIER